MRTKECARKNLLRGGKFIHNCMIHTAESGDTRLSAEDANKLTNYYGLDLYHIIMIAASHGYTVDEEGYENLRELEAKKMKLMKPCSANIFNPNGDK